MNPDGQNQYQRHEWPHLIRRVADQHQSIMDLRLDGGAWLLPGDGHESTKAWGMNSDCVVDSLPGLIWTACADGQLDFVNQRRCDYTGLSGDEVRGRGLQTAVHPDDLLELLASWQSILASDVKPRWR